MPPNLKKKKKKEGKKKKKEKEEKVYFRSQILERASIGEYWNISGVPVLPQNAIRDIYVL